ncbi:hypothetical protein [Methylobacterium sp. OAE515]|uniref:hypothetical protein n=1 Tax=Methylobacterium sp. OAE515 TaxID=2817895 RepID=UPI00178A0BFF
MDAGSSRPELSEASKRGRIRNPSQRPHAEAQAEAREYRQPYAPVLERPVLVEQRREPVKMLDPELPLRRDTGRRLAKTRMRTLYRVTICRGGERDVYEAETFRQTFRAPVSHVRSDGARRLSL